MDAKQAQEMMMTGSLAAERLRRCVAWIEKRILKAIQKGKWEMVVHTNPDTPFFNPCYRLDEEERKLIREYLTDGLGFQCNDHSVCTGTYTINWRPPNFNKVFMPCTEDSKLRHVVLTGQAPKVVV